MDLLVTHEPNGTSGLRTGHRRILAGQALYRHADTVGDGTGSSDAAIDASVASVEFKIAPPAGQFFSLTRMFVSIVDNANFKADEYGGRAALVNGISIAIMEPNGEIKSITDTHPIKTISDWAAECFDFEYLDFGAGVNNMVVARWTFTRDLHGHTLDLDGDKGEYLSIKMADDFSSLIRHMFMLRGWAQPSS